MKNAVGYIHSIESAGTLDGPGIRRILFLNGCPLNCLYCHNPDTRNYRGGRKTDAYAELRDIARNRQMLKNMKGGVTLSGGEPLCQPAFVEAVMEGSKMLGLHTALDTSGYLGNKASDKMLSFTDLVLLDIKSFRPSDYKRLTGVELQPTLDFAERLAAKGIPIWLRYVLVPGYTDDMSAIGELALFARELGNIERIEVLPFHKMGEYKWEALNIPYLLKDTPEPDKELVLSAKKQFERSGVQVF